MITPEQVKRALRTPRTALELSKRLGCSKPTAYAWIVRLGIIGVEKKRRGVSGPAPLVYSLHCDR